MNSTTEEPEITHPGEGDAEPRPRPALRRPARGRMLAGVAAAIAHWLGIDVTIVRVGFALLAIIGFTGYALGGLPLYLGGIPLYLACWLLIPDEGSEHSIAANLLHSAQSRSK